MDQLGIKLDNLENVLIQGKRRIPIVRKWGHPWMLLNRMEEAMAYSHLTEAELRQLHRRFGHPSVRRFSQVLERAGQQIDTETLKTITKYCHQCQMHSKSPGRFKFTLKDDYEFNYSVIADVLWINGDAVLQVVDDATSFGAAGFLPDMSATTTWNKLRQLWIDTYLGPPEKIVHDAGKNFASDEFRQLASSMSIQVKEVPVEAHNSIGKVERYHAPLRRAYEILWEELKGQKGINKYMVLQMAQKAVNDTNGPDGIVPTLLVFGAYPRIGENDPPTASVVQRAKAVKLAMKEVRRLLAKRQVQDALAMRNGPNTQPTLDLPIGSMVKVYREKRGWTGPYKLLSIDGETCRIEMQRGSPVNFRTTVVRPYYEQPQEIQPEPEEEENNTPENNDQHEQPNIDQPKRKRGRPRKNPITNTSELLHYFIKEMGVYIGDIEDFDDQFIAVLQENLPFDMSFMTNKEFADKEISRKFREQGIITTPGAPFEAAQKQEIDGLLASGVFEFVKWDPHGEHAGIRVFNSRLVNEVKGKATDAPFEKSRLVIQAYNDEEKSMILTQSPTIQRASQHLITALAPSLMVSSIGLWLRDVTQAYTQSTSTLNRVILANPPKEMADSFPPGTIMKVIRPLYGVPEAGTHWWATYNKHHREKLGMITSTYDPCLLITSTKESFGLVGMQTDDTIILADTTFAEKENDELMKAAIRAKPKEKLSDEHSLMFNGCIIKKNGKVIELVQKDQGKKIQLVNAKSENMQQSYREQRARGAYIATICQPEASFDLSVAAQHQNPTEADVAALNKRLQWQKENINRGLRYIPLDLSKAKLFVFVDGSFANNKDLSSQLGYEIILANEVTGEEEFTIEGNIIHYSSTKSKRVTRSVLASELYGMVGGMDMAISINTTIKMIMEQLGYAEIPIIICTDSYSLYDCLVKLGTTKEKRLMIDIMAIRQAYERRELTEIRWINGLDNPADAMTKGNPNKALQTFIDTNRLRIRVEGWVQRDK